MNEKSRKNKDKGEKSGTLSCLERSAIISALMILIFITTGCGYENRIHIWAVFHASAWSPAGDAFVFARGYQVYKKPKGLYRFPDGGRSKKLHQSISIYIFDVTRGKLSRIAFYDNTPRCALKQFWDIGLAWEENLISCSINTKEWDKEKKKYRPVDIGYFSYDLIKKEKRDLAPETVSEHIRKGKKGGKRIRSSMELPSREIQDYTKNVPISDWGVNPLDYCRLSNRQYVKDLMTFSGDRNYRNAVIEHLGNELGPDDIKKILKRFNRRMEKLKKKDSYRYLKYKYSIEEIQHRLKNLSTKTK